jgi:hypothetical protein
MDYPFERKIVSQVMAGLKREKKLLHIITGPRQVGKTTAARQLAAKWPGKILIFSADSPIPPGPEWIKGNWERALRLAQTQAKDVLLVFFSLSLSSLAISGNAQGIWLES